MQTLKKFNHFFGFTPTEGKVVLFLLVTFVIGGAIKLYRYHYPSAFLPSFDYSQFDKEFDLRARLIDSTDAEQKRKLGDASATTSSKRKTARAKKADRLQSVVNINTATKAELMKLPGIGEALAERILIYRDQNGAFKDVSELQKVKGIGGKKFGRIRPLVKVE